MALLKGLGSSSVPFLLLFSSTNLFSFPLSFFIPPDPLPLFPSSWFPQLLFDPSAALALLLSAQREAEQPHRPIQEWIPELQQKPPKFVHLLSLSPIATLFIIVGRHSVVMLFVITVIALMFHLVSAVSVGFEFCMSCESHTWHCHEKVPEYVSSPGQLLCVLPGALLLQDQSLQKVKLLIWEVCKNQWGWSRKMVRTDLDVATMSYVSLLLLFVGWLCCIKQMAWQEWIQTCRNDFT